MYGSVSAGRRASASALELQGAQARRTLPNGRLGPAEPIGELDQAPAARLPVERRGQANGRILGVRPASATGGGAGRGCRYHGRMTTDELTNEVYKLAKAVDTVLDKVVRRLLDDAESGRSSEHSLTFVGMDLSRAQRDVQEVVRRLERVARS